tara:strand:+ start:2029 stop:2325 length:297 start_codon:yes stop_codon:yes gene_type:complete
LRKTTSKSSLSSAYASNWLTRKTGRNGPEEEEDDDDDTSPLPALFEGKSPGLGDGGTVTTAGADVNEDDMLLCARGKRVDFLPTFYSRVCFFQSIDKK